MQILYRIDYPGSLPPALDTDRMRGGFINCGIGIQQTVSQGANWTCHLITLSNCWGIRTHLLVAEATRWYHGRDNDTVFGLVNPK